MEMILYRSTGGSAKREPKTTKKSTKQQHIFICYKSFITTHSLGCSATSGIFSDDYIWCN